MRFLIIAAMMAIAGYAFAAHEEFRLDDAGDLVQICATQPSDPYYVNAIAFCHGFLAGSFRYYLATTPLDEQFLCAPGPVPTRRKVMNDFVAWAKAHPQYAQYQAVDVLFRYLAETYPCAK